MKCISLHSLAQVSWHSSQVTVVHFLSSLAMGLSCLNFLCSFLFFLRVRSSFANLVVHLGTVFGSQVVERQPTEASLYSYLLYLTTCNLHRQL